MAILFFKYLAISNNETSAKRIKYLPKKVHNFAKYYIVTQEMAKNFLKFNQSGAISPNLVTLFAWHKTWVISWKITTTTATYFQIHFMHKVTNEAVPNKNIKTPQWPQLTKIIVI